MIKFNKPNNLNGTELLDQLSAADITVNSRPLDDGNDLWLDISESDKDKAKSIVTAHNGTVTAPDNSAARQAILDRLGITAEEAQILLS